MTDFDLTMFVLVTAVSLWGAYLGLVRQATTLGAWLVGILAAAIFRQPVAQWIGGTAPTNQIGAAIIILFASSLLVHLLGGHIRRWVEEVDLEGFDRQMGFVLGAVKGVALATLITIASYHFHEPSRDTITESFTAKHVATVVEQVEPFVPPPANAWVAQHATAPFVEIRDQQPPKQPQRVFVASRPTMTR